MITDLWTLRYGDSYIAFTLQFIDEDFIIVFIIVMHHMTIDCQPFSGKYNAAAIHKKLENVLFEYV